MKPMIRVKSSVKDAIEGKPHKGLSRRDFIARGLYTGAATVMLPHALTAAMAKSAFADSSGCPAPMRQQGALAQVMRDGGPNVGSMFIHEQQAQMMNATMAERYGINMAKLSQVGSNWYLATTSPFAMALMTAPPGFSQSQWNAILMKTSLSAHFGPFNADDGAGNNSGLVGAASPLKSSQLGKDLRINNSDALAAWSQGKPSTNVGGGTTGLTAAKVAANFGITPSGKTTSQIMSNSAQAANSLGQLFAGIFGTSAGGAPRTGASLGLQSAVCGFFGDAQMASPTFGNSLFNPTQISALSSAVTLASLSNEEQALLAAYYQSAMGVLGGVIVQQNGNDYHGNSANSIGTTDYEAGRMVAMFIAACAIAGTKGAWISLHNGQTISGANNNGSQSGDSSTSGFASTNITFNNQTIAVQSPNAQGDAGGSYNAGFILCFDPSSAPNLKAPTGNFNTTNGNVQPASAVASVPDAVAGLYLTAFAHLGLDVSAAQALMQGAGAASNPSGIMLI